MRYMLRKAAFQGNCKALSIFRHQICYSALLPKPLESKRQPVTGWSPTDIPFLSYRSYPGRLCLSCEAAGGTGLQSNFASLFALIEAMPLALLRIGLILYTMTTFDYYPNLSRVRLFAQFFSCPRTLALPHGATFFNHSRISEWVGRSRPFGKVQFFTKMTFNCHHPNHSRLRLFATFFSCLKPEARGYIAISRGVAKQPKGSPRFIGAHSQLFYRPFFATPVQEPAVCNFSTLPISANQSIFPFCRLLTPNSKLPPQ